MRKIILSSCVALLACSAGDPAKPTAAAAESLGVSVKRVNYDFTIVDSLLAKNVAISSINDNGLMVGVAQDDTSTFYTPAKPVLFSRNGQSSAVNTGSDTISAVFYGVNDRDQVAGATYSAPDYTDWRAAIYDLHHDSWTSLPSPGVQGKDLYFADDLNDLGVVIGASTTVAYEKTDGWLWDGQKYTIFDYPDSYDGPCPYWEGNGRGTVPQSINDRGQVSGYYSDSNCLWQGFLKTGSKFTQIGPPGAGQSLATGITNEGAIGGTWCSWDDGCYSNHGFVLKNGVYAVFDFPSSWGDNAYTFVAGINDAGVIVGSFYDPQGIQHGYVGVPHT